MPLRLALGNPDSMKIGHVIARYGIANRRRGMMRWPVLVCLVLPGALFSASCREQPRAAEQPAVVWRKLGSWSGRGSTQTDPFISDTGSLRLTWATKNEAAPGTGTFRVTVHSDVSGRSLVLAVDARGVGHDVTYVTEDPRQFFLVVESANLDWTLAADEGIATTVKPAAQPAAHR